MLLQNNTNDSLGSLHFVSTDKPCAICMARASGCFSYMAMEKSSQKGGGASRKRDYGLGVGSMQFTAR